jgi:AcrR family transcriptional regulator
VCKTISNQIKLRETHLRQAKKEEKKSLILESALKLFSIKGFHKTTIPDIAKDIGMSVGNMYNYFTNKEILAQEIIKYTSDYLGNHIKEINEKDIDAKEKIRQIVELYFTIAQERPHYIEYFLRVYLSNREVFSSGCEGIICVSGFVTEIMLFFEDAVSKKELRNQDFFSAFGLFMGYLGGMVFLNGEAVLPKNLSEYVDDISLNIYNALKYEN